MCSGHAVPKAGRICQPSASLKSKQEFIAVFTHGKWLSPKGGNLKIRVRTADHFRYGFVISRKVGCAVVRNRLRRQLREILRTGINIHKWKGHVVLTPNKELVAYDFQKKKQILLDLLSPIATC